jgi:protein phosphatase
MSAFVFAWVALGKHRAKAQAKAARRGDASPRERRAKAASAGAPKAAAKTASAKSSKTTAPKAAAPQATAPKAAGAKEAVKISGDAAAPKAIFWQVPQSDEDITVLRAIPVFDNPAEPSAPKAAPKAPSAADPDEERPSQIELIYEADAEAEEVTAASARILVYAAGDSDRGRVRQRNEDCMLLMPERSLFAVADGMGGHRGGEVASRIAIDTLADAFHRSAFEGHVQADGDVPRRARELAAAVQMTNECVRSMALADRELSGMGTTLVAARFSPNKQRLYVGHVGDSRCYRLRQGNLRQLTTDHTLASLGMHGARANDLYQAVGVSAGISIDLIVDKPQDDDVYLLCSDGLSKMLSDDQIRDVLVAHEDLESALYTLLEQVNDRGAIDNVTAIIVKVLSRTSKKAMESLTQQPVSS